MASATLLMLLLLAPQVSGLPTYTDEAQRLRQHQMRRAADAAASMDASGRMQVSRHGNAPSDEPSGDRRLLAKRSTAKSVLQMKYPFYHTTDELRSEVTRLAEKCPHLKVKTLTDSNVSIDVINVRKAGTKPVNRVFLLFGEHSREMISPESGFYFLRALCGDVQLEIPAGSGLLESSTPEQVLEDSEFQIVLNANPRSRKLVEGGAYCQRMNPNGVDLNRNWDEHWKTTGSTFADAAPGPKPFSEPETRIFKKVVSDFAPTTFLTVHSGTKGMYMPWAYDRQHLAEFNGKHMMDVLRALDKDHCECPFGAAGREVGYPCPGTSLDYVYKQLNTPFSFAFEIYTDHSADSGLKQRWAEKIQTGGAKLLEKNAHLGHPHFSDLFDKHKSDFVGSSSLMQTGATEAAAADESGLLQTEAAAANDMCFGNFNPKQQDDYDKTVKNWAEAYFQMSAMIAEKMKSGQVQKGTVTEPDDTATATTPMPIL